MVLTLILLAAAISDARSFKIPNWIVGCGVGFGGASMIFRIGPMGIIVYLGTTSLVLMTFYLIYCTGFLGAGDVKLFAVLVSYMGINMDSLKVIWISFFCSLIMAVSAAVSGGRKMNFREFLHTPVTMAPAIFMSWIIYLGGTYIG